MKREFVVKVEERNEEVVLRRKIWNGEWVILIPDLDAIYGTSRGVMNNTLKRNFKILEWNVDYHRITCREAIDAGFSKCGHGVYLITKSGYEKLVRNHKKMSECVHTYLEMIDGYFGAAIPENGEFEDDETSVEDCNCNSVAEEVEVQEDVAEEIAKEIPKEVKEETSVVVSDETEVVQQLPEHKEIKSKTENEIVELFVKYMETEAAKYDKMYSMMENALNLVGRMVEVVTGNSGGETHNQYIVKNGGGDYKKYDNRNRRSYNNTSSSVFPKEFIDYDEWKKSINDALNKIMEITTPLRFKNRDAILSEAYTKLKNQYGNCWKQYEIDYFNETGSKADSTLDLQYWIEVKEPAKRNLLLGKLATIYEEEKKVC